MLQLALQSSTAAVGMLRVLGNVAVHLPLVPAVLYGAQKPIGVIAVTSKTFQLALQSSTAAVGMLRVLGNVAVHLPIVPAVLYGAQKPIGAIAVTSKTYSNLPCRAALLQWACSGS